MVRFKSLQHLFMNKLKVFIIESIDLFKPRYFESNNWSKAALFLLLCNWELLLSIQPYEIVFLGNDS